MIAVENIAVAISEVDSANEDTYHANAHAYIEKLEILDESFKSAVDNAKNDTIIVPDRFPLLYLATDYDFSYYAAFAGCSAETEASFETIAFLSDKATKLTPENLLIMNTSDDDIAQTIIGNSELKNSEIVRFNPMEGITSKDAENDITYYSIMEENLKAIEKALS